MDIALDTCMGLEFANAVYEFCIKDNIPVGRVGKSEKRPERSKHLETATLKIYHQEVDFVNLRTETYCDDSRIPVMEFGTPEEDALRRDITVNALFYNLQTRAVEDFTKRGIEDLHAGRARTPIDPLQTFIDDPLRILRTIRFAARFGLSVERNIQMASLDPVIQEAFVSKISKERVGIEVMKMFGGPDPCRAMKLMQEFGIFDKVFAGPPEQIIVARPGHEITQEFSLRVALILQSFLDTSVVTDVVPRVFLPLETEELRLLYLASAMLPYKDETYMEKKILPSSKYVAMTSLKLSASEGDWSSSILMLSHQTRVMVSSPGLWTDRRTLGLFVRELGMKPAYQAAKPLAEVNEVAISPTNRTVDQIFQRYKGFLDAVEGMGVEEAFEMKHLLNGKEVEKLLKLKGPAVGLVLTDMISWQLENPNATDDECRQWLLSTKAAS
ncbi:CCA tRNA nucleotidyltransferase, mitochondrial [Blyttiomyces sp. JEL0837]|nr:CCA tRNA nucleotidyltransferase, mitochondrial [Blyttiomyces sp. JEL0837]